jgi:hypothetical protein
MGNHFCHSSAPAAAAEYQWDVEACFGGALSDPTTRILVAYAVGCILPVWGVLDPTAPRRQLLVETPADDWLVMR